MRTVLLMYLSFLLTSNVFAQERAFKLGVRLSGGYGLHNGIDKILVSEIIIPITVSRKKAPLFLVPLFFFNIISHKLYSA